MLDMNIDKTHLLSGFSDPKSCYCTVWLQTVHHSEMAIRVASTLDDLPVTQKFYWIFTGVVYYSGPLRWKNADFVLDTQSKKIIISKLNKTEYSFDEDFYGLFKFSDNLSGLKVEILASGILRVENLS